MKQFSVLMSLYHAEDPTYLNACLESTFNQTAAPDQVVLVLDGPVPQALMDIVDKWVRLEKTLEVYPLDENVGLGMALNFGMTKCRNDLVARVDTDDVNSEFRFEKQLKQFSSDNELSICGTFIDEVTEDSMKFISPRHVPIKHENIVAQLITRNPFNHMTVMFKKSDIIRVGGYKHLESMEDWYLWLRLLSAGHKASNIAESLVFARTGLSMLSRRSGFRYVKCEYRMMMKKLKLIKGHKVKIVLNFFYRALPRLLPKCILERIYIKSRFITKQVVL
ncbi:glycosyltransferase [Vibrio gigantis]|uniref:glycosyltransferase n=1 Tax=Vibrio gigantis TaxID=296199 RepID=UPI0035A60F0C